MFRPSKNYPSRGTAPLSRGSFRIWSFVQVTNIVFRMEFQGMGEVASPKSLDAGVRMNELLGFANSGEEIYDRFINPKFKVS
jgi:hypothetical protein